MLQKIKQLFNKEAVKDGTVSKSKIHSYLPKKPVVVEAGAHVGVDTVEMAQAWKDATIHAFEPVKEIYKQLEANTKDLSNVHAYELALGEKTGKADIFVSGGTSDGSSSLLKPKDHITSHPEVTFKNKQTIKTITLSDWAKKYSVKKVDFFWLDMQGLELQVMKASPEVVKKASVIYTEVSLIETYEGAATYPEVRVWLESLGFTVVIEELPWEDMGNILFVNNKKLKELNGR